MSFMNTAPNISETSPSSHNARSKRPDKITRRNSENRISPLLTIIICIFFALFFVWPIAYSLYYTLFATPDQGSMSWLQYSYAALLAAILFSMLAIPIGIITGKIRAHRLLTQLNQQVSLTNPYQYYKELPNQYGIGIATLLSNSTIENEKDIIAAILDLCAQGYLRLSKHSDHYVIRLLPPPANKTPLANESYLLELIKNHKLSQINYSKWYQLCVQDGVQAELFNPIDMPTPPNPTKAERHQAKKAADTKAKILGRIYLGMFLTLFALFIIAGITQNELISQIAIGLFITIFALVFIYAIFTLIANFAKLLHDSAKDTYKETLEQHLRRTPKGIAELQKLLAFKAFLSQFDTFTEQNPEGIILWDRYLSYAQVFGIAHTLMKTGYDELVNNAAFKIDNIDNITIDSLSIDN